MASIESRRFDALSLAARLVADCSYVKQPFNQFGQNLGQYRELPDLPTIQKYASAFDNFLETGHFDPAPVQPKRRRQ